MLLVCKFYFWHENRWGSALFMDGPIGGPGPSGSALRILRWVPGAFSAGYWILADLRGLACFARCSLWSLLGLNFGRGARGGGGAPIVPSFEAWATGRLGQAMRSILVYGGHIRHCSHRYATVAYVRAGF